MKNAKERLTPKIALKALKKINPYKYEELLKEAKQCTKQNRLKFPITMDVVRIERAMEFAKGLGWYLKFQYQLESNPQLKAAYEKEVSESAETYSDEL